jgi:bifunctional non-homologous end joining protein LigD
MFLRRKPTIESCLPRPAKEPPSGPDWIHEIKHDGFRILAWRDAERVRLYTRHGTNFTDRFPKITAAIESLPVRSYRLHDHAAILCAFDLIGLDGADLR